MAGNSLPLINLEKCSGCGRCVSACPNGLISLETSGYRKQAVRCGESLCLCCNACRNQWPINAISPDRM